MLVAPFRVLLLVVLVAVGACAPALPPLVPSATAPSPRTVREVAPPAAPAGAAAPAPAGAKTVAVPREPATGADEGALVPQAPAHVASERACRLGATTGPPGFYWNDEWPRGEVVLTFDDGPHPTATPRVLDLLAKHGLVATFFVVGANIRPGTYGMLRRMVAEGHSLGSHSYNHDVAMSLRGGGERAVEYIRGQHEVTQILIDMALSSASVSEFEAQHERVFEAPAGRYLAASLLRTHWPRFVERHRTLLEERGGSLTARPYPVVFSRPPGGNPYVGNVTAEQKATYTEALRRLGLLNVLWHGGSGDTVAGRKHDVHFLSENLRYHSRRGGVLLIHDYMRGDALDASLARMAADRTVRVVPLEEAVSRKFGCSGRELRSALGALTPVHAGSSGSSP